MYRVWLLPKTRERGVAMYVQRWALANAFVFANSMRTIVVKRNLEIATQGCLVALEYDITHTLRGHF